MSAGKLSFNRFDTLSLELNQKIKKWRIKTKSGDNVSNEDLSKIKTIIEKKIVDVMKKVGNQTQFRQVMRQQRRMDIRKGKNNISNFKIFKKPKNMGSMTILKTNHELGETNSLVNAKFSEGNHMGRATRIRTRIDLEGSQISGSMDHMPLTRMNSKMSHYNSKGFFSKFGTQKFPNLSMKSIGELENVEKNVNIFKSERESVSKTFKGPISKNLKSDAKTNLSKKIRMSSKTISKPSFGDEEVEELN